jgi:hypothetical protein
LSTTDSQTAVPFEIPHIFHYTYVPSLPYMGRERRFSRLRIAKELLLFTKQTGTPLSPHKKKKKNCKNKNRTTNHRIKF